MVRDPFGPSSRLLRLNPSAPGAGGWQVVHPGEAEERGGAGWAGWAAAGLVGYGVYSYRGEDLKRAVEEKRRAEAWPEAALFVAEAYAN